MRILALETSGAPGSVAALEGEQTVAHLSLPAGRRTAQALAPTIAEVLAHAGWRWPEVAIVAVTQGPGSFTGLRIGAATAKTLAYSAGCDLVGINTLEAIAAQAPAECGEVWTLLDAYRGQLFAARYRIREEGLPEAIRDVFMMEADEWLGEYAPAESVTGPGVSRILRRLPPGAAIVDETHWPSQAETVGRLASQYYQQGRRDDVFAFAPHYYRPSAAEEKSP